MKLAEYLSDIAAGHREVVEVRVSGAVPPGPADHRLVDTAAVTPELLDGDPLLFVRVTDESDVDAAVAVLRRLRLGTRAVVVLAASPVDPLARTLISALATSACQVLEVVRIHEADRAGSDRSDVVVAVQRVDRLVAPRSRPADLRDGLRVVNEYLVAEVLPGAVRRGGINSAAVDRRLAAAEAKLRRLEASASYRVGQVMVSGVRHPVRAVVDVPRGLASIWRQRRATGHPGQRSGAAAASSVPAARRGAAAPRVVTIALPPTTAGPRQRTELMLTAPPRLLVPRRLVHGLRAYEPESLACFLAMMDVAGPGAVFDIGANIGIYAALASALTDRRVVGFEPTPELIEVAREFAAANSLSFVVEPVALAAETGLATFYLSDSSDSSNSLAEGFRASSAQLAVAVETLDSYVASTGIVPAVLKIDTETTEPEVLAGAGHTIKEHRPLIMCEALAGRSESRLHEVMDQFGYHYYPVTADVPYRPAREIVGDRTYQNLMWLFAPEPPTDRFWAAVRAHSLALAACGGVDNSSS